ncbi:sugar transferase [Dactylosporangium sp. CA-092794]|uniref:sugar transferase n=1 Tax=Dactylosporangium sp. CA-092794 TaxID=3239929 RepID=UPI003D948424
MDVDSVGTMPVSPPAIAEAVEAVSGQRRPRVVVLEAAGPSAQPDLLDADCHVVCRVAATDRPERLCALLAHHRPRLLLVKCGLDRIDERVVVACRANGVTVLVLALPVYGLLQPGRLRRLGGLPWIRLRGGDERPGSAAARRWLDLALVLATAPLSVPLMLLIALIAGIGGPPLYRQQRVGRHGRLFRMVKFRTMRVDAEHGTGPVLCAPGDERVTPVGRFLRRLRLDELPQLWNVLRGDMSLVGPRPERPEFITDHLRLRSYELRIAVRPGLTGIAQLTNGYSATAEEKLRCDLLYLNCRSLRLDLKLLVLTAVEFLLGFPRG